MPTTYLIAAGGTAGHVVPALAVADALRTDGAEVIFVGGSRAEATLVPRAGYQFRQLDLEGIDRQKPLTALRAAAKAAVAVLQAWRLIGKLKPAAVLGGGGYVAGPVGAAAVLRRVPLVITEADSHFGLTNRLLAPWAKRVCLSFPLDGRSGGRYLLTGRPIPPAAEDRGAAREAFGLAATDDVIVVVGGSLGADSINKAAINAFGSQDQIKVIHAAGASHLAELEQIPRSGGYQLFGYLDSFAEALLAADIVVSRSGGSVSEIAAAGRPAILVPFPAAAGDHQTGNARWMADAGAAVVIADQDLTAQRLTAEVERLFSDRDHLAQMANASLSIARPGATLAVANELRSAGGGR